MPNIQDFIALLKSIYPNPKIELDYENDFQLLVAIIMSAQSTDKQVNKINQVFFQTFQNPSDLVQLGQEHIRYHLRHLGLNNSKSKNIFFTSQILTDTYNEKIPETLELLQTLPGVGIKTAKVWLSVVKNMPYLAVDTHVHRVLNRHGFVDTSSPLGTDKIAGEIFSKKDIAGLHHRLVLFGRYICTARNPKCDEMGITKNFPHFK